MTTKHQIIIFGRAQCYGCQELKRQLVRNAYTFTYLSLDSPDHEFNPQCPISLAQWGRARLALAEAAFYQIEDNEPLPILLDVWADAFDNTGAYRRVNVLAPDGSITLEDMP